MSYCSIARFYKLIESVTIGGSLLDARLAHLQHLAEGPAIQHALLVGEGNGSFLLPFVQQFPNTLITVLDESAAMLRVARTRLEAAGIDTDRIAQWLLSDFQIPASGWRRLRARIWLTILYAFFRCVAKITARTVPPAEAILAATSFKQVARKNYSAEMLYSTLYERA
jgi:hypothetical protein